MSGGQHSVQPKSVLKASVVWPQICFASAGRKKFTGEKRLSGTIDCSSPKKVKEAKEGFGCDDWAVIPIHHILPHVGKASSRQCHRCADCAAPV